MGPIPEDLLDATSSWAREGVDLDVMLRNCFAGYTVFCEYALRAAQESKSLAGPSLHQVLRVEATLFERILGAIAEEYARERRKVPRSAASRQLECTKRLLDGESVEAAELAYDVAGWHIGAIAQGPRAAEELRELARRADRRLLLVRPQDDVAWAWFGGRRKIAVAEIAKLAVSRDYSDLRLALGEPARGIDGWRLTHAQAGQALRIASPGAGGLARYADVGLLASVTRDRVLVDSLQQIYLAPLASARDGGAGMRETLRAYFAAGRNVSSAASALGVSRQTVGSRLRAAEERLGKALEHCGHEVELALRLEALGMFDAPSDANRLAQMAS